MVVTLKKQQYYLRRAVDSEGNALDVLLQRHRDTQAAERFLRKLLKQQRFVPRVIVTDKLKSYAAAKKTVMPSVEHRLPKGLNNRAENSHQPTRTLLATHATIQIPRTSATIYLVLLDRFETTSTRSNIN